MKTYRAWGRNKAVKKQRIFKLDRSPIEYHVLILSKGPEKIKNLAILLQKLSPHIQTFLHMVLHFISIITLDTCLVTLSVLLLNWANLSGHDRHVRSLEAKKPSWPNIPTNFNCLTTHKHS